MQERSNDLSPSSTWGRETAYAVLVTALFLLVAGFSTLHHEMWRDEMGPWLIARDSRSILDIFHNIRYDGHPSLWYLLVWPLTLLTSDPQAMQWLNLSVCAAAVFVMARYAAAPLWLRIAVALGYFPVFEYGSIARNYSLGLLALSLFCALFPLRRERPLLLGLVLFVAANTSMFACLLAIAALGTLCLETLLERRGGEAPLQPLSGEGDRHLRSRSPSAAGLAGLGIAAAGILVAVYQMVPPADSGYAMGWHFGVDPGRVAQVLKNMTAAYLPLPKPGPGFWETELLAALPAYRALSWLLAPGVIALVSLALLRRPLALVYYLMGTLGLLAFFYAKHVGYLRHHGFLFLALASALWIASTLDPVRLAPAWDRASQAVEKGLRVAFPCLLCLHLAGSLIAVAGEYNYSFSAAKDTAELIRSRQLDKLPMIADLDVSGMPVVGYLDKPSVFYPCGDRFGSYVIWDQARMQHSVVWEQAQLSTAKSGSPVLVLVDDFVMKKFPLPPELASRAQLVGCRKGGIATEESYCVYLMSPAGPAANANAQARLGKD